MVSFTFAGPQIVDGREVLLIEAQPKNDLNRTDPDQEYARCFKLRLWVDLAEIQVVRVETQVVTDHVTFESEAPYFSLSASEDHGAGAHVSSTSQMQVEIKRGAIESIEWTKVNDEAWLPKSSYSSGKEALIFGNSQQPSRRVSFPVQIRSSFSDYKKFRVDSRVSSD